VANDQVEPGTELVPAPLQSASAAGDPPRASLRERASSLGRRLAAPWGRERRRRTVLSLAAGVLALTAVVGGSVALGWWWAASTIVTGVTTSEPDVVEVPVSSLADGAVMPDVRGLAPDDVLQVLADSGIPAADVQIVERAAAGPSGVVVEQTPVFGTLDPTGIEIVVSTPATMPALLDANDDDAFEQLLALGAAVEVVEVYRPGATIGLVVATDPAAGDILPATAVLHVTAQPATALLTELDHSSGCSSVDTVEIGDSDMPDSLSCTSASNTRRIAWQLDGAVDRLTAVLGLEDAAPAGARVSVSLVGDGTSLGQWDVAPGAVVRVDILTSGVAKFEIVVAAIAEPGTDLLIGTPTAYGASDPIAALIRR
jgi:hypothetical protein